MRQRDIVTAVLGSALWLGVGPVAAQDSDELVRRGEVLISRECARCHAVGRAGGSPRADAPALRDLSRRYPVEQLEEALAEGLLSGHPDMPEVRFEPADIAAVIAYLRSIQAR